MILFVVAYIAIVLQWLTLVWLHRVAPQVWQRAHRATWWLLLASVIVGVAWILNSVWLSLLGTLCALTAVSFIFQVFTDWMRKRKVSSTGVVVWLEWLMVFSITLAHVLVLAINYLHEIAN